MNDEKPLRLNLLPEDNQRLSNLCGPLDENLRQIENALDVTITRRGAYLSIYGAVTDTRHAKELIAHLYTIAEQKALSTEDVHLNLIEMQSHKRQTGRAEKAEGDAVSPNRALQIKTVDFRPRTVNQAAYITSILNHDITFGLGPAGTGKTYLAVACAVDALNRQSIKRIILTRPVLEAGEKLGFLPGDLAQKVDPYLRPLYDALYELMGFEAVHRAMEQSVIEIAPLAYMRGRTLSHAFIILDEAQNTTTEQMKMFLTRIGVGSKAVVTGDITQTDLAKHQKSGLLEAREILQNVRGIAFDTFTVDDVVRHPLVARIISAYEKADGHKKE